MIRRVFGYGSLVFPAVMQLVAGRPLASVVGCAVGLRREALRGVVYPAATLDPEARASGRLYGDLGPRELGRLDAFEGDLYERIAVDVETSAGVGHRAWAYVIRAEHRAQLAGRPWDEARFEARELASYLEGCRAFARDIERT